MAAVTKTQTFDEKPPSGGFFMENEKRWLCCNAQKLLHIERLFSKTGRKLTIFCRQMGECYKQSLMIAMFYIVGIFLAKL